VTESGDDISPCLLEKTLIIANHQSTADVPLMMHTFNAKEDILPNIMWIMDRMFKFTNFGACSVMHEDYFISSVSHDLFSMFFLLIKTDFLFLFIKK
jgi:lysophosphatidylglycerol acyltransferase 1